MKSTLKGPLADGIGLYLAHKHSLGKELAKVGPMLHLLDGYLLVQGVVELRQLTPAHIDGFVASRPRPSPRSYNGLIGSLRGLFDWMVRPRSVARVSGAVRSAALPANSSAFPLQPGSSSHPPRSGGATAQQPRCLGPRRNIQDDFCSAVRPGAPGRGSVTVMPQRCRF